MAGTFLQCLSVRRIMAQCRSSNIKKVNCKHVYVYTCVDKRGLLKYFDGGRMECTCFSANWTDC